MRPRGAVWSRGPGRATPRGGETCRDACDPHWSRCSGSRLPRWRPTCCPQVVTPGTLDLTGPLTALLVVQATAFSTIKMGAVRVGAVLSGILVATLLSTWSGLTWWSLARGHRRVPAAGQGAAPRRPGPRDPHQRDAHPRRQQPRHRRGDPDRQHPDRRRGRGRLQRRLPAGHADGSGPAGAAPRGRGRGLRPRCCGRGSRGGTGDPRAGREWIDRVRSANREVARATETIGHLKDSRRFNPRALGTVDVEPVLASALDTFEHCLLAIRAPLHPAARRAAAPISARGPLR